MHIHTSMREICTIGIMNGQLQNLTFYESTLVSFSQVGMKSNVKSHFGTMLQKLGSMKITEKGSIEVRVIHINKNHRNPDQ